MATVPNIFAGQNEPKLVDLDTNFASLGSMANQDSTGVNIDGGTIDGVTIGASVAPTVTNLGSVATCDINGGTIDGAVIGGSSRAAGSFTTLDANGNVTLGDASSDTVTINGYQFNAAGAAATPSI